MQELIPLGRNSGAHLEDLARSGEFQTRWSVVEGRRGRRMLRGGSSRSSLLMTAVESWGSIPPSTVDASEP